MNRYCVVFLGDTNSGKTQLYKQIVNGKNPDAFKETPPTIISDYGIRKIDAENSIHLFDLSGNDKYKILSEFELRRAHLGMLCIDLSQSINQEQIKQHIKKFHELAPKARVILVGTKSEIALDNIELLKSFMIPELHSVLITSAKTGDGIDDLLEYLRLACLEKGLDDAQPQDDETNLVSPFIEAVNHLQEKLSGLPEYKRGAIDAELNLLLIRLSGIEHYYDVHAKTKALTDFSMSCEHILQGEYSPVSKAIIVVLVTAAASLILGFLALGLGLALGTWVGSVYFTSNLLFSSAFLGIGTGTLTAFGLFRPPKEMKSIDEFVTEMSVTINL